MVDQSPRFQISPLRGMVDAPLKIRLANLSHGGRVIVTSSIADGTWTAEASFEVDTNGTVDLETRAPISGSYSVADPMGLIWSASLRSDHESALRVMREAEPFTVRFDAVVDGNVVATETVIRESFAGGVQREVVRDDGLFGTLFVPAGRGPHPAIMLVSGSEGGLSERLASLFAAHGIAGFALAYFNFEALPKRLCCIPLEYFGTGIDFLRRHRAIDGERLAIGGGSRGGELSLLLGSVFPQFKAIIAWAPSGLVWEGFGDTPEEVQPAWLLGGQSVPFMDGRLEPSDYNYARDCQRRGEAIPLTPAALVAMQRFPHLVERATISVERINGAVLLVSGEDDQMQPSTRLAEIAMARFREHDFPHPYQHLRYPDAGHGIAVPPCFPTMIEARHPVDGVLYAFGGTPESNAHAAIDSWQRMHRFIHEHL